MQINGYRTSDRLAERHPPRRRPGRHQQDVLVRVPPRHHEPGHRHPRARGPDPHRHRAATATPSTAPWPGGATPATRSANCRPRSSSPARRPSGAGRPRSSATSWASGSSGCRRNRRRPGAEGRLLSARWARPAQATPSSDPGSASSRTTRGDVGPGGVGAAVLTPVVLAGDQRGHHRGRPPDGQGHPGARDLGDPAHQRAADGGGAQEGDGVEGHDPSPHRRFGPQLQGGVGGGDEGDGGRPHGEDEDQGGGQIGRQRPRPG